MRGRLLVLAFLAVALAGGAACRQGDPQDPHTHPNSPIPSIDRPNDSTSGGDAGASMPSSAPLPAAR